MSVLACLRADTEVHVAWVAAGAGADGTEAVALTPGGGRMGSLLQGALDHALVEATGTLGERGGLVRVPIGPAEALISGHPEGGELTVALVPGSAVPLEIWELLAAHEPVSFAIERDGDEFTEAHLTEPGATPMVLEEERLVCTLWPVSRVVIAGAGPIAEALVEGFALIGWRASTLPEVASAEAMMATLSPRDAVVVMGHDVETSGRALQAAIASRAGYIGSIGSTEMQDLRERWLSFRDISWSDRIRGPAGLPIGASNPGEIAISIVAEAVASLHGSPISDR